MREDENRCQFFLNASGYGRNPSESSKNSCNLRVLYGNVQVQEAVFRMKTTFWDNSNYSASSQQLCESRTELVSNELGRSHAISSQLSFKANIPTYPCEKMKAWRKNNEKIFLSVFGIHHRGLVSRTCDFSMEKLNAKDMVTKVMRTRALCFVIPASCQ